MPPISLVSCTESYQTQLTSDRVCVAVSLRYSLPMPHSPLRESVWQSVWGIPSPCPTHLWESLCGSQFEVFPPHFPLTSDRVCVAVSLRYSLPMPHSPLTESVWQSVWGTPSPCPTHLWQSLCGSQFEVLPFQLCELLPMGEVVRGRPWLDLHHQTVRLVLVGSCLNHGILSLLFRTDHHLPHVFQLFFQQTTSSLCCRQLRFKFWKDN